MEDSNIDNPIIIMPKIKVYIRTNTNKIVTSINSSNFFQDFTDWIEIDEGNGDKYAHAQGNYLEKRLMDEKGRFNYKYDTALVELTEAEKEVLFPLIPPQPTVDDFNLEIDYRVTLLEIMKGV